MTPLLPESRSSGGARPIRYIRRDGHLRIARQQQQQRHVNTLAAPCQIMKTAVLMVVVALSIWEDGGLVAVRHVSGYQHPSLQFANERITSHQSMKRTQCSFFVSSTKITCGGLSSGRQRARRRLLSPIGAMTRWKTTALASDGFTSFSSSSSDDNDGRMQLQKGSVVALVTPMTSDYKVDTTSLRKLLQYHIQSHTDGLCILGTTGEATTLTMAEREQVLEITVDECKHKMPILVGTGAIDPQHIKEHTSQAIHMGCDASLVVTPYYVKPPQRGLVRHYHAVADMGLPVIMYNVPGRTGVDMSPATIGLCAEHPNIIGVKEATGDVPRLAQIISEVRKHRRSSSDDDYQDFLSYSGDDGTCADFVLSGGHGCISVTANILPQQMHNVMSSALLGDAAKCHELNDSLDILHQRLFVETNPIPTKYALCKMGMITSDTMRPPLTTLDPIHFASLEEALKLAGAV